MVPEPSPTLPPASSGSCSGRAPHRSRLVLRATLTALLFPPWRYSPPLSYPAVALPPGQRSPRPALPPAGPPSRPALWFQAAACRNSALAGPRPAGRDLLFRVGEIRLRSGPPARFLWLALEPCPVPP